MKNILSYLDIFGYSITLTHKNFITFPTKIGITLSILILLFLIGIAIFFITEIFQKQSPTIIESLEKITSATINLRSFPIMVEFTFQNQTKIDNSEKYARLGGLYIESDNSSLTYGIHWEKCDETKHFTEFKELLKENSIKLDNKFCVDPNSLKVNSDLDDQGEIKKDIIIKNNGEFNSNLFSIFIYKCDSKRDNIRCDSQASSIKHFIANFILIDYYINNKSYNNPLLAKFLVYSQPLNYQLSKKTSFIYQLLEIITDSGILFYEPYSNKTVFQLDQSTNDILKDENILYELAFSVSSLKSNTFRKYIKIQEILANLGGLFNFVTIAGKLICYIPSRLYFYFDIAESLFYIESNEKCEKKENDQNNHINIIELREFDKINISTEFYTSNQQLKKIIYYKPVPVQLNLRLREYIKNKCCKKNIRKEHYTKTIKMIQNLFEVNNMVKYYLFLTRFLKTFLINLKEKHFIISRHNIDTFNFEETSLPNDYIEDIEKNKKTMKYFEDIFSNINSSHPE